MRSDCEARCILLAAHVSGSLSYSGCGFDKRVPPDLPPFVVLEESGPPEEILKKLFFADPLVKVTREGTMIRMMETSGDRLTESQDSPRFIFSAECPRFRSSSWAQEWRYLPFWRVPE